MSLRSPSLEPRALDRPNVPSAVTYARDDWEAPPGLFQAYHRIYGFTVDAAANAANACVRHHFDKEQDGLVQPWKGHVVWCHPPHSDPGPWMRKAMREAVNYGVTVVALVPADTSAEWWHRYVMPYASVRFLQGVPQFRLQRLPITDKVQRRLPLTPFAVVVFKPGRTC